MKMPALLKTMRPGQWVKNVFIFSALIFAQRLFDRDSLLTSLGAFVVFCAISGAVYIVNDLLDLEEDRRHPVKSKRPLASGQLRKRTALVAVFACAGGGLACAWCLDFGFFLWVAGYFALQLLYGWRLKHVVILDVFVIAIGFVIRVVAGAQVIQVEASPWLLICTILLALFLALSKRRHELILLDADASDHRPVLGEYSAYLLDQMISVVTASTVVAYCLYTMWPTTVNKFKTDKLVLTVPFVLYGIFRYLYLVHQKGEGGSPEALLVRDKPLLGATVLWMIVAVLIIYFAR